MIKRFFLILIILFFFGKLSMSQIDIKFSTDTTVICEGGYIQFSDLTVGDTVFNWKWDFGDGTNIDTIQNPLHQFNVAGTYSISLTASSSNTTQTKTKNNLIIVRQSPQASINYTDTMFLPSYLLYFKAFIANKDDLLYKYYWNFDNVNYLLGDSTAIYSFPSEGSFIVSLIVEAGKGCRDTVFDTLSVKDVFEAPNIFSPNGDNLNDVFVIKSNGETELVLDIFNRWGAIVYSQTAKRLQWDGYSSAGVPLPCGTYFYHITSTKIKGYKKSGVLLLVK